MGNQCYIEELPIDCHQESGGDPSMLSIMRDVIGDGEKSTRIKGCCCSVAKSCSTLCDTIDCSPPDSSIHGIFQARILEWVAISCSRESS